MPPQLSRVLCSAVAGGLLLLAGCTGAAQPPPAAPAPQPSVSALPPATDGSPAAERPAKNDLVKMPLARTLKAGRVTISVEYSSRVAIKRWQAGANKPLKVTLTAVNNSKKSQKIYLTKVTANVTVSDEAGTIDAPLTLTDTTNISPGFIVAFPSTYNQTFVIPPVEDGATSLTVDFGYELLLEVDRTARDYSKDTASDIVVIPVAA